jgi:signal transduction histidine kinase
MSYLLHPPLLDEHGLTVAIRWYIQGLMERSSLKVELEISGSLGRLSVEMEMAVFRVVQECLTNIHRHSGSKTAGIRIVREDGALTLTVCDEGRGMRPERLSEIQSRGSGVGMRGMRERVLHLSGTMSIDSDSSGTRIYVVIPIPKTASRRFP